MIGQQRIRKHITDLVDADRLPRFILLVGGVGSGRKTLSKWIAQQTGLNYVLVDHDINSVRNVVKQCYEVHTPMLYTIADANTLSDIAQNVLLKVTEEPPNNAYFVLTVSATSDILNTLVNRSEVMRLDVYSAEELKEYLRQTYADRQSDYAVALDICRNMGDIDHLFTYDVQAFMGYVNKVVDNIAVVSGANSFKIAKEIGFKETDTGYDIELFLKAFIFVCLSMIKQDVQRYAYGIKVTSKYLQDLSISGINKASTFDMWLLDIRKGWLQ